MGAKIAPTISNSAYKCLQTKLPFSRGSTDTRGLMQIPRTVQPEEIVWVLLASSALILSAKNLRQALRDRKARIKLNVNGRQKILVRQGVRIETVFTAIHAGFVGVGFLALSRSPSPEATTVSRAVVVAILLLAEAALLYLSVMTGKDRQDYLNLLAYDGKERRQTD